MTFTDQIGDAFFLPKTPQRIVCLVPSITELLVALGLEDALVGITKFCEHPARLRKQKQVVGGTKNIRFDKIKALVPELIICNKEENTKAIVQECRQIAPTYVSDIYTIQDTLDLIADFGSILSCAAKAQKMITTINTKQEDFLAFMRGKTKKKVAYFIWKNPWMVAANNTFIQHLLTLNHFENVFVTQSRYPEVSWSKIQQLQEVELILLSSEPYPFQEKNVLELQKIVPNTTQVL